MIRYLMFLCVLVPIGSAQQKAIDWATFPVEREAFVEAEPGRYGTAGRFDGVGMMYFSPSKKLVEFKGLRRIELPHMGQEADDKYEFRCESFTIESVILVGDGGYAFQAKRVGPFPRTVIGKIRFSLAKSGLFGKIEEFRMDEQGQTLKGVMNRYVLPKSAESKAMLQKYDKVFFGGNYVALDFDK